MSVTLETTHPDTSMLNAVALLNISCILMTFETSQLEMSSLKLFLSLNNRYMDVTCATFQSPISPNVAVTVVLSLPPLHHEVTAAPIVPSVSGVLLGAEDTDGAPDGALDGDRVEVLAAQASAGGVLTSSQYTFNHEALAPPSHRLFANKGSMLQRN
jgi:hypothetical protein